MSTSGAVVDDAARRRVGLIGTFDLANYGDLLLPAITERELLRRRPDLVIRRMSPYGWEHPVPMDGGELAEPLGAPTPQRRADVAAGCDALVIGGGEILHFHDHLLAPHYEVTPEEAVARAPSRWFVDGVGAESATPTAWNAIGIPFDIPDEHAGLVRQAAARHRLLVVRDEQSRKRLEQVGVEQEIHVVPEPGFVVNRLFDHDVLERRRRLHTALGWSPPGRYVVVQGNGSMLNEVDRISMALDTMRAEQHDIAVVLVETGLGHGDTAFAAEFAARHPGRVWRADAPLWPVDLAAILAGAETFIGVSLHGAATAISYGRRAVVFNAPQQSKLRGLVDHLDDRRGYVDRADELPAAIRWALGAQGPDAALAAIGRRIDAHFDRLTAMIDGAGLSVDAGPPTGHRVAEELHALRTAHAVRGRRLVSERDALATLIAERDERLAALEAELATTHQRAAEAERHVQMIVRLKSMRWLRPARRVYARFRR